MIHYTKTITTKQLYNLLVSIYTAPNDYLCTYSYGVFVGWTCKSGFVTEGFGSSEVDRLCALAKTLEKGRRKELAVQNIG